ncbi:MAG: lysylphosphatidylglycerol synthase transmembrane domain-containing protein [Acidimicrobiales bacterium]
MTNRRTTSLTRFAWRATKIVAFAAATWFLAVPQLPLVWKSLPALASINVLLLILGIGCAFAALVAYAQLTRTLLDDGHRPGLWHSLGIVISSLGVNRVMPAGAAAGSIVTFRLLARAGVGRRRAAFVMTTQSIGSALVLNALLWVALLAVLPARGFAPSYLVAVGVGAAVFGSVGLVVDALLHCRRWLWTFVAAIGRALPVVKSARLIDLLDDQSARMVGLAARRSTLRRAMGWAVANWLFDAAALWIFLRAFDVALNPVAVLVAFAFANVASLLPITPGGLGVVELTMAAALAGFGAPSVPTALGVAAFRVFNYWSPIPAAGLAYLSIRNIHRTPVPVLDD